MILYPFIYLHIYLYRLCRCRCRCLRPLSLPLPHFLLDGRLPIVNPISKSRNATALLQASAAATAARDKFHCDRFSRYCDRLSRYCDRWKRQQQPGSKMEPVGHANIPSPTSRPRKQLHNEPRLRPTNGQTKALRLPILACAPAPSLRTSMLPSPPTIFSSGCSSMGDYAPAREETGERPSSKDEKGGHLLPHWEGVWEVDWSLILPQLRHIDQAAEAILDAAPVRKSRPSQ